MARNEAIQEVIVTYQNAEDDVRGRGLSTEIARTLGISGMGVRTADIYYLQGIDRVGAHKLARGLLCEPVTQTFSLDGQFPGPENIIRVGYKPGAMNPATASIREAAADLGVKVSAVDTAVEYRFPEGTSREVIEAIERRLFLFNPIVQREITEKQDTLLVKAETGDPTDYHTGLLYTSDQYAQSIASEYGFGNVGEVLAVKDYFKDLGREPTVAELYVISAWWSEHCKHKTFNSGLEVDGEIKDPLFKRVKDASNRFMEGVISAYKDNSGATEFYGGYAITIKGETHNSPSGIEPFGGAGTGVGGILRDITETGQGAEVIFVGDILCFGHWKTPSENVPRGTLHPNYLSRRVVDGIADYGNKFGAPTVNGSVHYHPDYGPKPTVMVIAAGLTNEDRARKVDPKAGDLAILVGGRTGMDGIGGATFSSHTMTDETATVHSQAVQIGNPIEEKRFADASKEITEKRLVRARNDLGAAGISSGFGELGKNVGITIDLSKVPTKYPGLTPAEILISESQERFALTVDPQNADAVMAVCRRYGVEATVIGHFDGSMKFNAFYGSEPVVELEYDFLESGLPQELRSAHWEKPVFEDKEIVVSDWLGTLKKVLSHGNVCSKQPIVTRYDYGVQGSNALPPFGGKELDAPNDAAILTPVPGKPWGVVIAHGLNPILNRIDPYWGTVWACTESMANYVAAGGDPKTAVYNENFVSPTPTKQYLGSLDKQIDAIVDFINATKRPVISGKDSLSSTFKDRDSGEVIEVPPVVALTVMGKIPDVEKTASTDIKEIGSTLVLVGQLDPAMGGSTLYDIHGTVGNEVPKVNLLGLPRVFNAVYQAIKTGSVRTVHDVSEGGVIGAVVEMCFGGDCGVNLDVDLMGTRPERFWFNETAGAFVVEVKDSIEAKELFGDVPYTVLGQTQIGKQLKVEVGGKELFNAQIDELKEAWKTPLQEVYG